jgi:hypothetical protein
MVSATGLTCIIEIVILLPLSGSPCKDNSSDTNFVIQNKGNLFRGSIKIRFARFLVVVVLYKIWL